MIIMIIVGIIVEISSHPLSIVFFMVGMAATEAQLEALLASLSIAHTEFSHPEVKTVEEWRPHITSHFAGKSGTPIATKSIFLKDKKDQFYLLVALADSALDLKLVTKTLSLPSGSLRFGPAESLKELLGAEQGAGRNPTHTHTHTHTPR